MCDDSAHKAFELNVLSGTVPAAQIRYLLAAKAQWWVDVIEAGRHEHVAPLRFARLVLNPNRLP
jgi:hypothetical protein